MARLRTEPESKTRIEPESRFEVEPDPSERLGSSWSSGGLDSG